MVRETSINAYNEIKESGALSRRRWQVYSTLFGCGPATANELFKCFDSKNKSLTQNNMHARLNELRALGVVKELEQRGCSITGKTCIVWDVTKNLPVKLDSKMKNTEKIRRLKKAYLLMIGHVPEQIRAKARSIIFDKI